MVTEVAKIKSVKYDVGVFDDARSTRKYVKAPFDIILIKSGDNSRPGSYVQPTSIGASEDWFANSLANITNQDRLPIGYIADEIVVPASSLGDHEGHSKDWMGCFKLGMI